MDPVTYHQYQKTIELLGKTAGSDGVSFPSIHSKLIGQITGSTSHFSQPSFAYTKTKRETENRPDILEILVPEDPNINDRRPCPEHGYLDALAGGKTTVVPDSIHSVTASGTGDANVKEARGGCDDLRNCFSTSNTHH